MRKLLIVGLGIALGSGALAGTATSANGEPPKPAPSTTQKIQRRPPTAVRYTDLAITNIGTQIIGCRIQVTWTNKGTTKIDANVTQRVEIVNVPDPQQVVTTEHVVLEPGASFVHLADPSLVVHGATQVLAWIDVSNVLGESQARRANNSATRTLTCGRSQPDLVASTVKFELKTTTQDAAGHTCKILRLKPVVLNIGTAPTNTPFTVVVEADSGPGRSWSRVYQQTVSSMTVGQTLTLGGTDYDTCLWFVNNPQMTPNDGRRFRLTVDTTNQVRESDETNNETVSPY